MALVSASRPVFLPKPVIMFWQSIPARISRFMRSVSFLRRDIHCRVNATPHSDQFREPRTKHWPLYPTDRPFFFGSLNNSGGVGLCLNYTLYFARWQLLSHNRVVTCMEDCLGLPRRYCNDVKGTAPMRRWTASVPHNLGGAKRAAGPINPILLTASIRTSEFSGNIPEPPRRLYLLKYVVTAQVLLIKQIIVGFPQATKISGHVDL
ncbi:hypothetical protein FN846DRAFT_604086 [Sphaerosporella brunnea]|uniref:Uncharacterized protein n=1 Tax=Sphaerosporella brunnea TaxID=1250544 RepID=A0A5J5F0N9_9PEZI|nr:hypothetical protein FN846DRAFT_604086 [Sphaerosporella brunnea]